MPTRNPQQRAKRQQAKATTVVHTIVGNIRAHVHDIMEHVLRACVGDMCGVRLFLFENHNNWMCCWCSLFFDWKPKTPEGLLGCSLVLVRELKKHWRWLRQLHTLIGPVAKVWNCHKLIYRYIGKRKNIHFGGFPIGKLMKGDLG